MYGEGVRTMKRYIIIYVMVWSGGLVQVRSSQAKERPATPVDQGDDSSLLQQQTKPALTTVIHFQP